MYHGWEHCSFLLLLISKRGFQSQALRSRASEILNSAIFAVQVFDSCFSLDIDTVIMVTECSRQDTKLAYWSSRVTYLYVYYMILASNR